MSTTLPFKLSDPTLFHEASLPDGRWVPSRSDRYFDVKDPGIGRKFASCPSNDIADVDAYIETSHDAFVEHKYMNPRQRAKKLLEWHRLISIAHNDIAKIVVYETGKPKAEAFGVINYALGFAWWFPAMRSGIAPIDVCVALVLWNFPIAMVIRKVAAALAAGRTTVIRSSPETPFRVLALADLVLRAGFSKGMFNIITTDNSRTPSLSEALCKHPLVRKVAFAGSTAVTLELGGNCSFTIFDGGDLEQAVAALMILKWRTVGQACTHVNRVYIQSGVYIKFASMIVEATKKLKVGHGADAGTTMGLSQRGKIIHGGGKPKRLAGNFFEPTTISEMTESMLTTKEEILRPLLGLYKFGTEEEARLLENLEAGMVRMNTGNPSTTESPFGGIKEPGYGKEAGKGVPLKSI
ncbi:Aldehyde/histidinol dehydrogenase [Bisporella sp. PMI_857]|nr:Aldehyde/histidinol dehydrogenase [Bisporella sp. PMI_857]